MVLQVAHPGLKDCFYGSRMHQGEVQLFQSVSLYTDGNSQKYAKYVSENSLDSGLICHLVEANPSDVCQDLCNYDYLQTREAQRPRPCLSLCSGGTRRDPDIRKFLHMFVVWYFLVLL